MRLRLFRFPFILVLNLFGLARYALARAAYALTSRLGRSQRTYVEVDLRGALPFGHPRGFGRMFKADATFLDIQRDFKTLAEDPRVTGVIIEPGRTQLGLARAADLADELDRLREAGKHVVAHAASYQTSSYIEATSADAVVVEPAGRLYTFGPRFEQYFLRGAFEKHGIAAQFVQIGRYKATASRYVRGAMSGPERRMMEELREGLVARFVARVASRRDLSVAEARSLFAEAPTDARRARRSHFIDAEAFRRDLAHWLTRPDEHRHQPPATDDPPEKSDVRLRTMNDYLAGRPAPLRWRPLVRRPRRLAMVDLSGIIIQEGLSLPGSNAVIDPQHVLPLLERLERDPRVAGVLLHINSPGGSALSSDLIWHAVATLRGQKPVVAYCSDVAASGGYYIACGADRIVCRPETLTGSIGVVAGKFALGQALERLGVHTESVDGRDGSEFMSLTTALTPRTLDNLREDARTFYRRFLQRVGQARGIDRRRLHRYARGRVYLGEEALHRGLVDDVGGYRAAVQTLRDLCREDGARLPEDVDVTFYAHQTHTLRDALRKSAFEAWSPASVVQPLALAAMMRREPLLALLPMRLES